MIKQISFFTALGLLWNFSVQAQEVAISDVLLPDEAIIAKKLEFREPLEKDIDFAARNYRPERLKEQSKAINFIQRRQAELLNLNKPEKEKIEVPEAKIIEVQDPKKVKEFLKSAFIPQLDEADDIADKEIEAAKDTPFADVEVQNAESPLK